MQENNTNAQAPNIEARITLEGITPYPNVLMSYSYLTFETIEELERFVSVILPWYLHQACVLSSYTYGILGDMLPIPTNRFNNDYILLSSLASKGTLEIGKDYYAVIGADGKRNKLHLEFLESVEEKDFYNIAKIRFPIEHFDKRNTLGIERITSCECEARLSYTTLIKYTYEIKELNKFNSITKRVFTTTSREWIGINYKTPHEYSLNITIIGDVSENDTRTSSSVVGFNTIEEMDRFVSNVLPWYFSEAIKHSPNGILSVEPQNLDYANNKENVEGFLGDYKISQNTNGYYGIKFSGDDIYINTPQGTRHLCISLEEGITEEDIFRAFSSIEFPLDNSSTKYASGIKDFKSITAECEIDNSTYVKYTFNLNPDESGFSLNDITKTTYNKEKVIKL